MASHHSFSIPKADCLSVDPETLIWYLHLVIFGYSECILCSKQKSSLEGVQHHMVAKAHCRFDIAGDFADFYDLDAGASVAGLADTEEHTLTLPNGKVIRHRLQPEPRQRKQPSTDLVAQEKLNMGEEHGKHALTKSDRTLARLATQLSHFRAGDQQSLAHLPASELRSVLLARKKQISTAKRQERRWASKMEAKNNKIMQGHFKPDVPGRING